MLHDTKMPPTLVISLDFELAWGVRDVAPASYYRNNLLGARAAVTELLALFRRRGIRATWATVGALFCTSKSDFLEHLPHRIPRYDDARISPYEALDEIGEDERSDPYHFAPSLVRSVAVAEGQELATHTFSHYYCLEDGQTDGDFAADLASAVLLAQNLGVELRSIVFPRNQHNPLYDEVLRTAGIRAYRSNGRHWAYRSAKHHEPTWKRGVRLADAYLPISGARAHRLRSGDLVDVPASAFLRPYSPRLRPLDSLRLRRLGGAMTHAARLGKCFHLWWHPHNFGVHLRENLAFLSLLLDRFDELRRTYGMESATMIEAAEMATPSVTPSVARVS